MTASVILPHDPPGDEYTAARRHGLDNTDIAALTGHDPHRTHRDIWHAKTGADTPPPHIDVAIPDPLLHATLLDMGLAYIRRNLGTDWIPDTTPPALLRDRTWPLAHYTPQRLADGPATTMLIHAHVTEQWLTDPLQAWWVQAQWGMGVTGVERTLIAAICAQRPRYWIVYAQPGWFTPVAAAASQWWALYVARNVPSTRGLLLAHTLAGGAR